MDTSDSLYLANSPDRFWRLLAEPDVAPEVWARAMNTAAPLLPEAVREQGRDGDGLIPAVLSEALFGSTHWEISRARRLYYALRPLLPDRVRLLLHRLSGAQHNGDSLLCWPIDDRYVRFLHATLEAVQSQHPETLPEPFWPDGAQWAFVLTHDVETAAGQSFARRLADVDERYGFRASFNFVPESYPVDQQLIADLRERGFEIGVHGLKHDGRLYSSRVEFERRAERINGYLRRWEAVGFRAPFTHRHPEWMQSLEIEYDSSFFDTDPYETIPGGTMSIWPFFCGRFVELPYTLAQDSTLFSTLGQRTPKIWLDKVEFIAQWGGMALVNVHPDYVRHPRRLAVYQSFLRHMADRRRRAEEEGTTPYWHTLPREVARWWRARAEAKVDGLGGKWVVPALSGATIGRIGLSEHGIEITI